MSSGLRHSLVLRGRYSMSRAVTPARRTKGPTAHAAEGDGARLQLVKYFPIETGLTYIGLASVVVDATKSDSPGRKYWLLAIFVALLVVTIADLYRLYPKAEYAHPIVPIAISGGAFIM